MRFTIPVGSGITVVEEEADDEDSGGFSWKGVQFLNARIDARTAGICVDDDVSGVDADIEVDGLDCWLFIIFLNNIIRSADLFDFLNHFIFKK
jgi:hypothetical protein